MAAATPDSFFGALALPVGDDLTICLLGLLVEGVLAGPDLFERVAGGLTLAPALGGHARSQLEAAHLLGGQRRPRERVVLALDGQVPAEHRELARRRDDCDLHPTARADALIEGAQRPGRLGRCPGGLDEHSASVRATLLGDPPVAGGLTAGLLYARV